MTEDTRKASDLFVECLEAEGVEYVFGIPGEETLELNRSLDASSIDFVPVRHEQGGAYMADMYGRLTQRAGVCLGTLGPGATNLVTAIADAYLDHAPLVALTGQGDLQRMHKESHQYIDVVSMFQPITKWNARLNHVDIVPEVVRKAFKVAQGQKPGPTHIELPEDVMEMPAEGITPLPVQDSLRRPEPHAEEIARAAELIRGAECPVVLAGNGVMRTGTSAELRAFAEATGIGVAATFMGKGVVPDDDDLWLGTVGMQARDYELAGFADADVVITVGFDLVEHAPSHWNPDRDKRIVCIDTAPVEVDANFITEVDLIGDLGSILGSLAVACADRREDRTNSRGLQDLVSAAFEAGRQDDAFPMHPARALWELRQVMGRSDILISDVGLHKLWISRIFPAYEPDTVFIANGLAGMGIALPTAIAAKLVHPDRHVITINGDGGFLMNCQELETAARLKTAVVNIIWENAEFGSIVWKQDKKFGRHFGTGFTNPDFVKLADAFGIPGYRCGSVEDLGRHLRTALDQDGPSIIVVPIDYSQDVALSEQLGTETVAA
jgi:acetolactate synthase-1/2/3 large subunit